MRIFIKVFHVGVRRRIVQVEVILFDVFTVVAFAIGQSEHALFDDRIFSVPQRDSKAEQLLIVRDAGEPVLSQAVSPRAGLVVAKVIPGIAVFAVIFAHSSPLALAQLRTPVLPGSLVVAWIFKSDLFGVHRAPRCRVKTVSQAWVNSGW